MCAHDPRRKYLIFKFLFQRIFRFHWHAGLLVRISDALPLLLVMLIRQLLPLPLLLRLHFELTSVSAYTSYILSILFSYSFNLNLFLFISFVVSMLSPSFVYHICYNRGIELLIGVYCVVHQ